MVDASTLAVLIWLMRYSTQSTRRIAFVVLGQTSQARIGRFVTVGKEPSTGPRFVTVGKEPSTGPRFVRVGNH